MITKILRKHAKARKLVEYLAGSGEQERRLLETNLRGETARELAEDLADFSRLERPRLERFVKHIILSFAPGEELSDDELRKVLYHYLEKMGYGNAPFAAYVHTDTSHPHLHIVTTPTSFDDSKINESWDWPRSERVAREIERKWGLRKVELSATAKQRAPKSEEIHAGERLSEDSRRQAFQFSIGEMARQAKTLPTFLENLAERGFEVRVMIDAQHRVRGFSFGQDGVRFKGSQLGRSFKGEALLISFGIDFEPRRDIPLLKNLSQRFPGRISLMTLTEARPAPAPEATGPLALPAGRYQLAAVDPKKVSPFLDRLSREDLVDQRFGWSERHLEEARTWIAGFNGSRLFLVRPEPAEGNAIGFRGVSREQVADLKRDGYEPAWTVRVGERFDVLLKTHEPMSETAARALRSALVERYDLPRQGGVYMNAVRLPGAAVVLPGDRREVAQLVELREEPFSASKTFLERVQDEPEREAIRGLVAQMPREPWEREREAVEPPLGLPDDSPLAGLQSCVEEVRTWIPPSSQELSRDLRAEDLFRFAQEANAKVLAALAEQPAEAIEQHPTTVALLAAEGELARRARVLEGHLVQTEEGLLEKLGHVEALARQIEERPELATIHRYQMAAREQAEVTADHQVAERALASIRDCQAALDRERLGAALATEPARREVGEAFEQAVRREIDLGRRSGREVPLQAGPNKLGGLVKRLEALEDGMRALRAELRAGKAGALPMWERATRERHLTRDAIELAQARLGPNPRELGERARSTAEPQQALQTLVNHQRGLYQRASVEGRMAVELADPADRLRYVASRVAQGDLSPEALRRLNAELIRGLPTEAVPVPGSLERGTSAPLPKDPKAIVDRYLALREDIVPLAARAAQVGEMEAHGRVALLARSSEAVGLHQEVEKLHRRMLGVIEPGAAPPGVSQSAWNLAWLQRAVEKGLLPEVATAQLGNAPRAPTVLGSAASGRALWMGFLAARTVVQGVTGHLRRVMTQ